MVSKLLRQDFAKRQFRSPQEKKKERKSIIIVLFLTLLVPAFFYFKDTTTKFINPLDQAKEYQIVNENPSNTALFDSHKNSNSTDSIKNLEEKIKTLINGLQGSYGLYYIDLFSGAEILINADRVFDAASVVKIIPMALFYQLVEKGELDLSEEYVLQSKDIQAYGTGSMQNQEPGKVYTYADLLNLSGNQSDNTADWLIRNKLGKDAISNFLGLINLTKTDPGKVLSTPKEIGIFFLSLEQDKILSNKYKNLLYDNLTDTEFEERIPAGIPKGIRVVHKVGNGFHRSYNDCGIVFASRPFILCVMSQDASLEEAMTVIPLLAKAAYEWSILAK